MPRFIAVPVGQGDAFYLDRGEWSVLVDGGRSKSTFATMLQDTARSTAVDVVVCTHNDADHANGVLGFLQSGLVCNEVWLPGRWLGTLPDVLRPFVEVFGDLAEQVAGEQLMEQEPPPTGATPLEQLAERVRVEEQHGEDGAPLREDGWPEDLLGRLERVPEESGGGEQTEAPETTSDRPTEEPAAGYPVRRFPGKEWRGVERLAEQFREKFRDALLGKTAEGEKITWRDIRRMAKDAFGGTEGDGAYTSKDMYDAMEAGVNAAILDLGKDAEYNRLITAARSFLPTQTTRTLGQLERQQFSTPPVLAHEIVRAAAIRPGETVLEPSAGSGSLAVWAKVAGAGKVEVNDIEPRRIAILRYLGFSPTDKNAEKIYSHRPELYGKVDVVVMNPPFSTSFKAGGKKSSLNGIRHVLKAASGVRKGGRVVALLGAHQRPYGAAKAIKAEWEKEFKKLKARLVADLYVPGSDYVKYGHRSRLALSCLTSASRREVVPHPWSPRGKGSVRLN